MKRELHITFRQETNERLDQIEEKVDKCNARCRARSSVLNDRLFEQECRLEFLKDELVHSGYLAEYDISLENDGAAEEIL